MALQSVFPLENELDYFRNLENRSETSHLEFWGPLKQEGMFGHIGVDFDKNLQIYKALRLQGKGVNLMYSVWCQDGAHELYDMSWDPYQMSNLHPEAPTPNYGNVTHGDDGQVVIPNAYYGGAKTLLTRPTWNVIHRLDALVLVLKTCKANVCREPWKQLHPGGSVNTLIDALDEKHDSFYTNSYNVAKVGWHQCYTGISAHHSSTLYDLANEQPLWLNNTIVSLVRSDAQRPGICNNRIWVLIMGWLGLMSVVGY